MCISEADDHFGLGLT